MGDQAINGEDSNASSPSRPTNHLPFSPKSAIEGISFPPPSRRHRRSRPAPSFPKVDSSESPAASGYTPDPFRILGRYTMSLPQVSRFLMKWATTYFAAHQIFIDYFAHLQLSLTKLDGLMEAMHGILQDKRNYVHQHLKHYVPSYQTAWVNGCELLPSLHSILADSEASVYAHLQHLQRRAGRGHHDVATAGQYIEMDDVNTRPAVETFFHAFVNHPALEKFGEALDKLLLYAEMKVEIGVAVLAEEGREALTEGG